MKRTLVFAALVLAIASTAATAQVQVIPSVNLSDYNDKDGTWQAKVQVGVNIAVCPETSIYDQLDAGRVKDNEEAIAAVKSKLDKIQNDLQRQYDKCHGH